MGRGDTLKNIHPYQRVVLDWVQREMGGREDDELTAKGWLTLHPRSGITFSSIDDIIEDFYNFIEYLAIEGISDLCYRIADFIAMEEELGEYLNE